MPGSSDQLILAADGVLGPGTVAFTSGGVARNLQKLTLFNRDDATCCSAPSSTPASSRPWLGVADDQRVRLDADNQRLFLPYAGTQQAAQDMFNPTAYRLNITAVANHLLTSEATSTSRRTSSAPSR